MKQLIFTILILASFFFKGQHAPINTQYMYHGLLVNPAITGSRECLVGSVSYRNQWLGNKYTPSTSLLSLHTPLKNEKISLGTQLYYDKVFQSRQIGLGAYGAYRIVKDQHSLSFGIKVGVYQNVNRWDEVNIIEEVDPNFQQEEINVNLGVGLGIYYRNKNFYFGTSIPEMLGRSGNVDFSNVNIVIISGYAYDITNRFTVIPNVLLRKTGYGKLQSDLTLLFRFDKKFTLGGIYRSKDIVGISLDYLIKSNIQIGYTFDVSLSPYSPEGSIGSHELSLIYEFKKIVETTSTKFF